MLRALFPLSLKADDGGRLRHVQRAALFSASCVIVPRAISRFERMWVPRTDKKGIEAARMSLVQESPSSTPGLFIEPGASDQGGFLNCWIWDPEDLPAAARNGGLLVPETFARQRARRMSRLVACLAGFEGQLWGDSGLVATRWWRGEPSEREWDEFVSGSEVTSGISDDGSVMATRRPQITSPVWRRDISLSDFGRGALETAVSPVQLLVVVGLVLSLPLGYLSGEALKVTSYVNGGTARLAALQVDAGDIADARRQAIDNRAAIESLAQSGNSFELVNVLTEIGMAIAPNRMTIEHLAYNKNAIELRFLANADVSLPALISKLESGTYLRTVSAKQNNEGRIVLRGEIDPLEDST